MQHRSSITYYYCSSFFAEERRARKKRRRPELKGTHTSFFNYSMNSLRSYSISYLVTQPKVETRYNKKTCMLFSLFVRNADMPAGLSFLLIFYESSILKSQRSKCRLISFARLRTGASALYFLVYEWIFSERE